MKTKEYDFTNAKRGAIVKSPKGKTLVSIRLDNDILEGFREQVHSAGGGDYESLINEVLRRHLREQGRGLEKTLRKIIREELSSMAKRAA
ncbi:BrnA antitoxin family protein [bacterium]|nr:MAG: CopG family transcriptional regulator [candidate division KSB1 bacterium]MCE7945316.1 CopG family transcriptional regulator [Chlorobi bacterium CHB1]MCL4709227.1 BrnA antitoxin family protein [bacterium]MDL1875678.1 BrnA antitoxin family protein [Cytophagia bacterium CHB2]MBC6947685.1 CopG family transcriptional regulator [candidate division KSB1 bacterium]